MENCDRSYFAEAFGNYIKIARISKKITQGAISKHLGVAQSYYCNIENGKRTVDLHMAIRICAFLGLGLDPFVEQLNAQDTLSPSESAR